MHFGLTFLWLLFGCGVYWHPPDYSGMERKSFKLALIFAGAYLFAITILHIFPELFADQDFSLLHGPVYSIGLFAATGAGLYVFRDRAMVTSMIMAAMGWATVSGP